ncbi:protein transport protein Sec31A-like isoform X2 [Physella acuta]|uniref:protein transport protein Sec31A-like isoform X2 n=1 Tax=Physella acuta TaxID=109671 RepID=UPI0027DAC5AA|nr:protein transport protein Sec31A-like isoform X2 [Physella acuta]
MRVKEIDRTANMAWSPENKYPIYVATGTAAQQLDATFSTTSAIELYSLNLDEATLDMPLVSSVASDVRFHKIVWGPLKDTESGVIIGGGENGSIHVYSADKLLAGSSNSLSTQLTRHTGAVKALDLNPFQSNLLASGAGDSEIFIWDLLKTDSPMTPGQKSQPAEELACVAWNCQVQHILGSTFASKCVVWDLRKNEPIIKISDSMSRIKAKLIAWHPEIATQLCLSSEDDHTPVIQVWDLRYATSPLKVLESHQKGVLSMSWCKRDPDLLLSCGRDNRILCWNPNSNVPNGEVVYDLSTNNQWCFDIQWCTRNPSIISSASFDGHITLYSLMGGGHPVQPSNKVAESFGGAQFGAAPVQLPHEEEKTLPLQKPPKWIRKPVGATFAFGGKLVNFILEKSANPQQPAPRVVTISQVVTETELVVRSNQLEQALGGGKFAEFCAMKAANSNESTQENFWNFMRVNFEKEPRTKFLELLGYDQNELARKVVEHTGIEVPAISTRGVDAEELAQKMSLLNTGSIMKADRLISSGQASPNVGSKTPVDPLNDYDGSAAFDEIAESQSKTSGTETPLVIPRDNADGLMTQALLTGNFEAAVEMCLSENKMAEAILLAIAGGPDLLVRTQKKYFQRNKSTLGRLISSVVTHDWGHIVDTCDLDNWKEALAVILTYALPEEFSPLCDTLANRLETERDGELSLYASLCYICSGNVEKLVENWVKNTEDANQPLALQDLVEKIMVLRKAVELSRGDAPSVSGGALADKLSQYASLLAAQGNMATALTYLSNTSDVNLAILQDRLLRALGQNPASHGIASPFQQYNVLPTAQQTAGPKMTPAADHHGSQRGHQSMAGQGGSQTTSTSTANYYSQAQYYSHVPSAINSQVPSYAPQPTSSVAPSGPAHKGPKYPQYPSSVPTFDPYSNQSFMQPNYNQPKAFDNPQNMYSPNTFSPASNQQSNFFTPVSTAGPSPSGYNPAPVPQIPQQPAMYSYQDKAAETAWNDPPIVQEKASKPSHAFNQPNLNLFTPQPADHGPPGAPSYPGLYNPAEHQHIHQIPAAPVEAPAPVQRGPIPAEHQVLQDIFDKLVKSCAQVAPNAQMKRKLEDVMRKLEILYDKLRENMLSQTALLGLHQIVQAIQQYDYNSGLNVYTGMVSHGNFSEISNFMPALKVLIQSAMQLQVYVQ